MNLSLFQEQPLVQQTEMVKLASLQVFTTTFILEMLKMLISQLASLAQPLLISPSMLDTTILILALEEVKDAIGNVDTISIALRIVFVFLNKTLKLE